MMPNSSTTAPIRLLFIDQLGVATEVQSVLDTVGAALNFKKTQHRIQNWSDALGALSRRPVDVLVLAAPFHHPDEAKMEAIALGALPHPPLFIRITATIPESPPAYGRLLVDHVLVQDIPKTLPYALEKASAQIMGHRKNRSWISHLTIHERGESIQVPLKDVKYFRAEEKYITVRTQEREYLLESSLVKLERLYPDQFLKIHRNCLVARSAIVGFERVQSNHENGWRVIVEGIPERLVISRRQQQLIRPARQIRRGWKAAA